MESGVAPDMVHCPYPECGQLVKGTARFCKHCQGIILWACKRTDDCAQDKELKRIGDDNVCDMCGEDYYVLGLERIAAKEEERRRRTLDVRSLLGSDTSSFALIGSRSASRLSLAPSETPSDGFPERSLTPLSQSRLFEVPGGYDPRASPTGSFASSFTNVEREDALQPPLQAQVEDSGRMEAGASGASGKGGSGAEGLPKPGGLPGDAQEEEASAGGQLHEAVDKQMNAEQETGQDKVRVHRSEDSAGAVPASPARPEDGESRPKEKVIRSDASDALGVQMTAAPSALTRVVRSEASGGTGDVVLESLAGAAKDHNPGLDGGQADRLLGSESQKSDCEVSPAVQKEGSMAEEQSGRSPRDGDPEGEQASQDEPLGRWEQSGAAEDAAKGADDEQGLPPVPPGFFAKSPEPTPTPKAQHKESSPLTEELKPVTPAALPSQSSGTRDTSLSDEAEMSASQLSGRTLPRIASPEPAETDKLSRLEEAQREWAPSDAMDWQVTQPGQSQQAPSHSQLHQRPKSYAQVAGSPVAEYAEQMSSKMEVLFVLLVPSDVFSAADGDLAICLDDVDLGGINQPHFLYNTSKITKSEKEFGVYQRTVTVEKRRATRLEYKYVFLGKDRQVIWEHLHMRHSYRGLNPNRVLALKTPLPPFHVAYDGYFEILKPRVDTAWYRRISGGLIGENPILVRCNALNGIAFAIYFPKVGSDSLYLRVDEHGQQGVNAVDFRRALDHLAQLQAQFGRRFYRGTESPGSEIFTEKLVDNINEAMARLTNLGDERWPLRSLGALVFAVALSADPNGDDETLAQLLLLARIPPTASPESVEYFKGQLKNLDQGQVGREAVRGSEHLAAAHPAGATRQLLLNCLWRILPTSAANRNKADDKQLLSFLRVLPIYHFCAQRSRDFTPDKIDFWQMPDKLQYLSGGEAILDAEWVGRMQSLDGFFCRSLLHSCCREPSQATAWGLERLSPLDCLAWAARLLSRLDRNSDAQRLKNSAPQLLHFLPALAEHLNFTSTEQPNMSQMEAEGTLVLLCQGVRSVLGARRGRLSRNGFSLDEEASLAALTSTLDILDRCLAFPPFFRSFGGLGQDLDGTFLALLNSWTLVPDKREMSISVLLRLMSIPLSCQQGGVFDCWNRWLLESWQTLKMPNDFDESLKEFQTLSGYTGLVSRYRELQEQRITELIHFLASKCQSSEDVSRLAAGGVRADRLSEALSGRLCQAWPTEADAETVLDHLRDSLLLPIVVQFGQHRLSVQAQELLDTGRALLESRLEEVRENRATLRPALHLLGLRKLVTETFRLESKAFFDALDKLRVHRNFLFSRHRLLRHLFPDSAPVRLRGLHSLDAVMREGEFCPASKIAVLASAGGKCELQKRDYGLRHDLDTTFTSLLKFQGNAVFEHFWRAELGEWAAQAGSDGANKCEMNPDGVKERLFTPVMAKIDAFRRTVLDGSVSPTKFSKLANGLQEGRSNMAEELGQIPTLLTAAEKATLAKRVKQLQCFRVLVRSKQLLRSLEQTSQELEFVQCQSELGQLSRLSSGGGEGQRLGDVRVDHVEELERKLNQVEKPDQVIAVLGAFNGAADLFRWARSLAKEGPFRQRDVDNFVNVVDNGEDEDRSRLLRDFSLTMEAFGPLLYDLPPDPPFAPDFVRIILNLLSSTDALPNAVIKLEKLARQDLPLLERLLDSAGKTAKAKVEVVDAIVNTGYFDLNSGTKEEPMTEENVLKLRYHTGSVDDEGARGFSWLTMGLKDLKDLHAELSIIASQMKEEGSTKRNILLFSAVFESLQGFLALFMEHWHAGNLFFASARCKFYLQRRVSIRINLHPKHGQGQQLRGTRSLLTELDSLCIFLEDSRQTWLDFIGRVRWEFPCLDHFTNRQVHRLRELLADFRLSPGPLTTELQMQLMSLREAVTAEDVEAAIATAKTEAAAAALDGDDDDAPKDAAAELMDAIIEFNYSAHDAARAIRALGDTVDVYDAVEWLKEHEETPEDQDQPPAEGSTDETLEDSLQKLIEKHDASETNLDERLQAMFRDYVRQQAEDKGLAEFIGIGDLGRILTAVRGEEAEAREELTLPSWVERGRQNLVLAPFKDLLRYCLSLYELSSGAEMSMANVFVCSETSTMEELQLFVNRIAHARRADLYSLLFVETLDSQVAQGLDRAIRELIEQRYVEHKFGLVLFCSKEAFQKSHLAGLLARHSRSAANEKWALGLERCQKLVTDKVVRDQGSEASLQGCLDRFGAVLVTSVGYTQGKSLCIRRMSEGKVRLRIPLHQRKVDLGELWERLSQRFTGDEEQQRVIHLDVSDHRATNVNRLVFQLLLLGGFATSSGKVWRLRESEIYVFEMTSSSNALLRLKDAKAPVEEEAAGRPASDFRFFLPLVQCHSPLTTLQIANAEVEPSPFALPRLLDSEFCNSSETQRCLTYLARSSQDKTEAARQRSGWSEIEILELLLKACGRTQTAGRERGVQAPSWLELNYFLAFLNQQLLAVEGNSFTNSGVLAGFEVFVVDFCVEMARDFATRSLRISEEVTSLDSGDAAAANLADLNQYSVKRSWEDSQHPYLFFNEDRQSFSFFGCVFRGVGSQRVRGFVRPLHQRVDLVDSKTGEAIREGALSPQLFHDLQSQMQSDVNAAQDLSKSFDDLEGEAKLRKLYQVLVTDADRFLRQRLEAGRPFPNPDPNYEVTADCALKMLAIDARFRCGIPVVVMGETGCGKTKLIEFYCAVKRLNRPEGINNFLILRVHGGTDAKRISEEVHRAKQISEETFARTQRTMRDDKTGSERVLTEGLKTVLFLDEANTTREMALVKELVTERSLEGVPIEAPHLLFALALNPYRRHTEAAIQKLENAGLGYHVQDLELLQKFDEGDIPMRHLVYRVNPLPPSLVPIAWDFGFLSPQATDLYIQQMTNRFVKKLSASGSYTATPAEEEALATMLSAVQHFMKADESESSFVSLRDVKRTQDTTAWFLARERSFFREVPETLGELGRLSRAAVLAVAVCYRASLQGRRRDFDLMLAAALKPPLALPRGAADVQALVDFVAEQFLDESVVGAMEEEVAPNEALRENVFMISVTAQLGIPLFLVGKPGSSKSLGKTIVADNMTGPRSESRVYKELKEIRFLSYQCSPLATADGVADVFRDCAKMQRRRQDEGQSLEHFGVVPVFDEIGMAEDSPKMPLKALHGLLEEGSAGLDGEEAQPWHRTGFVGISNWALDPANMNRGIYLARDLPSQDQLVHTAECICRKGQSISFNRIEKFIRPLTEAYLEVIRDQRNDYEFYGLRDFYSMMKQLSEMGRSPEMMLLEPEDIVGILQHNFSGQANSEAFEVFARHLRPLQKPEMPSLQPTIPVAELVRESLRAGRPDRRRHANRFLLLLTHENAALWTLQSVPELGPHAEVIFGSRFPQDLEMAQISRSINRIRLCMEKGQPVILLNLEALYESLYDLLNQAFVQVRGEYLVDIGLGTNRHRTRVDANFRLVVVAEMDEVRRCFPSALVNRLEKLAVFIHSDMSYSHKQLARKLDIWARMAAQMRGSKRSYEPRDIFVGYTEDTAYALVAARMTACPERELSAARDQEWLKERLMQTCVPEGVLRIRESEMSEAVGEAHLAEWAFRVYSNASILSILPVWLPKDPSKEPMLQITTYQAQLLTDDDVNALRQASAAYGVHHVTAWQLLEFRTEKEFESHLEQIFEAEEPVLLLIQCMAALQRPKLISACRYKLEEMRRKNPTAKVYVGVILMLHRLPFDLFDRVRKWAETGADQFIQIQHARKVSEQTELTALAQAAGLEDGGRDVHLVEDRERQLIKRLEEALDRARLTRTKQLLLVHFYHYERRQPAKLASEVRSFLTRKLSGDEVGEAGSLVRVLLLVTLPQMSSFPGRLWDSWYLDSLTQETVQLPSLDVLRRMSPAQLLTLSPPQFDGQGFIQNCVVEAAARIKDDTTRNSKRAERFKEIILGQPEFAREVLLRVQKLREEQEALMEPGQPQEWVYEEAQKIRSILDNRTFAKALQRRLEEVVGPLLAGLMCQVDMFSNLRLLLCQRGDWRQVLWQRLFADPAFLSVRLDSALFQTTGDFRHMKTHFEPSREDRWELQFPFSWAVLDKLQVMIKANSEALEGKTLEEGLELIQGRLTSSTWGQSLSDQLVYPKVREQALAAFIHDMVKLRLDLEGLSSFEATAVLEAISRATSRSAGLCIVLAATHAFVSIRHELRQFISLAKRLPGLAERAGAAWLEAHGSVAEGLAAAAMDVLAAAFLTPAKIADEARRKPFLAKVASLTVSGQRRTGGPEAQLAAQKVAVQAWNEEFAAAAGAGIRAVVAGAGRGRAAHFPATWRALEMARLFHSHTQDSSIFFSAANIFSLVRSQPEGASSLAFLNKLLTSVELWGDQAFAKFFKNWSKKGPMICIQCKEEIRPGEMGDDAGADVAVMHLPCLHVIHTLCAQELLRDTPEENRYCPGGDGRQIPDDFETVAREEMEKAFKPYAQCRQGLRFFFLDFLSGTVFGSDRPPEPVIIQRLLDNTTDAGGQRTQALSPLPNLDILDPEGTPVLRAFLLQQLLRYERGQVAQQLQLYYRHHLSLLNGEAEERRFFAMCVSCAEDACHRRLSAQEPEADEERRLEQAWRLALRLLRQPPGQGPDQDPVARFQTVAEAKVGLAIIADRLPALKDPEQWKALRLELSKPERLAQVEFLIRASVASGGVGPTRQALERTEAAWIANLLGLNADDQANPDAFLVYGQPYVQTRNAQRLLIAQQGAQALTNQNRSTMDNMALTRLALTMQTNNPEPAQVAALTGFPAPHDGDECVRSLLCHVMALFTGQDAKRQPLGTLLRRLVKEPGTLGGAFLLTMPEDTRAEVLAWMRANNSETTRMVSCPNGHPYIITNCGGAITAAFCNQCKAPIGGHNYRLNQGNVELNTTQDGTKPGHCLHPAERLEAVVSKERDGLSPVESTLLRLIQHLCMLAGAQTQPAEVAALFTDFAPAPGQATVDRLLAYIGLELRALGRALGKSEDDVALLLHLVFRRLAMEIDGAPPFQPNWLTSKAQRAEHERLLAQHLVRPVLDRLDDSLDETHQAMLQDDSENGLMQLAFGRLGAERAEWAFQWPATLAHQGRALLAQLTQPAHHGTTNRLLHALFQRLDEVLVVRHLPNVVKLQRILIRHFHESVNLASLQKMTVTDLLEQFDDVRRAEVNALVLEFFEAYRKVLPMCKSHNFVLPGTNGSNGRIVSLPNVFEGAAQQSPYRCPVEVLLPIPLVNRRSLASYCLTQALVSFHNDALSAMGLGLDPVHVSVEEAISRGGIIQIQGSSDLLPLVLLYRDLSVRGGEQETPLDTPGQSDQATRPTFHLDDLERNIRTSFLSQPCFVSSEVPVMELSEERLGRDQRRLGPSQVPLSSAERLELCKAFPASDDLARLNDAVRASQLLCHFLGGDETESLPALAEQHGAISRRRILKLEGYRASQVVDVWTTLSVHQALLRRLLGVEAHPEAPSELPKDGFSSQEAEDELGSILEATYDTDPAALHRLLTRFLILYAGRVENVPRTPEDLLPDHLSRPLGVWMSEEMGGDVESLDPIGELFSVTVADLLPLWERLAEHRITALQDSH